MSAAQPPRVELPPRAELPPQVELDRVVQALAAQLQANWSAVLADARWADVAASLRRLTVPGAVAELARDLGDSESARLAGLLLTRWAAIGPVALPPMAVIAGPDGPDQGQFSVEVAGLDPGWTASWHGPVEPLHPAGARVRLVGPLEASVRLAVRVFGRSAAGRTVLTAQRDVNAEAGPAADARPLGQRWPVAEPGPGSDGGQPGGSRASG